MPLIVLLLLWSLVLAVETFLSFFILVVLVVFLVLVAVWEFILPDRVKEVLRRLKWMLKVAVWLAFLLGFLVLLGVSEESGLGLKWLSQVPVSDALVWIGVGVFMSTVWVAKLWER